MINQELLLYIQTRLDDDVNREQIVSDLLGVGWENKDIDNAFQSHEEGVPVQKNWSQILTKIITMIMIVVPSVVLLGSMFVLISGFTDSGGSHHANNVNIKANMSGIRVQAELAYDNAGYNYNSVCGTNNIEQDRTIRAAIEDIDERNGDGEVICGRPVFGDVDAYAISAQLNSEEPTFWCVDSTGFSGETNTQIGHNNTKCPE